MSGILENIKVIEHHGDQSQILNNIASSLFDETSESTDDFDWWMERLKNQEIPFKLILCTCKQKRNSKGSRGYMLLTPNGKFEKTLSVRATNKRSKTS